jgi:aminomethyltransferase
VKAPPLEGAGYFLIGKDAAPPQPASDFAEHEALRIAAGYPAFPSEIGEDYIPLEAGLWSAVSFAKGCYIGQEIIARMESRGQIARKLVRLHLEPSAGAAAKRGDRLTRDGADAGVLTSVAPGVPAALGYVRSAFAAEGTELALAGKPVQARVVGLGGL